MYMYIYNIYVCICVYTVFDISTHIKPIMAVSYHNTDHIDYHEFKLNISQLTTGITVGGSWGLGLWHLRLLHVAADGSLVWIVGSTSFGSHCNWSICGTLWPRALGIPHLYIILVPVGKLLGPCPFEPWESLGYPARLDKPMTDVMMLCSSGCCGCPDISWLIRIHRTGVCLQPSWTNQMAMTLKDSASGWLGAYLGRICPKVSSWIILSWRWPAHGVRPCQNLATWRKGDGRIPGCTRPDPKSLL